MANKPTKLVALTASEVHVMLELFIPHMRRTTGNFALATKLMSLAVEFANEAEAEALLHDPEAPGLP